jgi:hypothetical protein
MSDNSMLMPPGGPASSTEVQARPGPLGPALLAAVLIIAGSIVLGVAGGAIWAGAAPRVVYQVYTLSPPTAYATNPETSAFIAADGWYCFIALAGGGIICLLGYLFGVRRYGPTPMVGIVIGSLAAAFIVAWLGHLLSGGPGFDHVLATSKPGSFLHAPIQLGSHGAVAFWPLAAAGVAGAIELVGVLKARHQVPEDGMPMPGMETFGSGTYLARPDATRAYQSQNGNGQSSATRGHDAHGAPGAYGAPGGHGAPGGPGGPGGPEAQDGGAGRVAP